MRTQPTLRREDSEEAVCLYMALELGHRQWHVRFGNGERVRDLEMPARDTERLVREIARAKSKLGLEAGCEVRSCYEAGLDGFWLHRYLLGEGVVNVVVDSASIEVNRRRRSPKTDRLDVGNLLDQLMRHHTGKKKVWSVVRLPKREDEDARQLPREINRLRKERQQHRCRIEALLWTQGVVAKVSQRLEKQLSSVRIWDGSPLPPDLVEALRRELERWRLVEEQLSKARTERARRLAHPRTECEKKAAALARLRGLGPTAGCTLSTEVFGWRTFRNGKQVGKLSGLSPTPYNSGTRNREQGIDKAGNREVRRLMVQLAWGWLRYQPDSALAQWFQRRFGGGGGRMRKVGIVALARKLIVAFWHYLEHGVIPEGAVVAAA